MVARGRTLQWLKSAGWIVEHLPQILQKRRQVQQTRKVNDIELFDIAPLPFTVDMAGGRLTRLAIRFLDKTILSYWRLIHPAPR